MRREEVKELHYIVPLENIPLILENGLLSHKLAEKHRHNSVAMKDVINLRKEKRVKGTRKPLLDYVNLYFTAHNPMLSKLRSKNTEICVLQIMSEILELPDVILTDMNAASNWASFHNSPQDLEKLDGNAIFAHSWTGHQDNCAYWRHKSQKCAEVLVPDRVESRYIFGAIVYNSSVKDKLTQLGFKMPIHISPEIFF